VEALIQSIAEMTGLGAFIFYLFRALSAKISGLEGVVAAQRDVMSAMTRRIEETEKIGGIYKNLLADLPNDLENYRTIVSKTKDDIIVELRSQKDEAERRISELKTELISAGASDEKVGKQLSILKNLIIPPGKSSTSLKQDLDLKRVCEFDGRTLESQVPLIIQSKSIEEFLGRSGYTITLTEDDSILREVFSGTRPLERKGKAIKVASASNSVNNGWFLLADSGIWLNDIRLKEWREEFEAVKASGGNA
jgi:hypothetical protein